MAFFIISITIPIPSLLREGGGEDALGRNNFDKQAIQHILNTIGVDVGVERGDIKNARRLGARNSGGVGEEERGPRPILVVLAHRYHAESILGRSWVLSEAANPEDREVSIVKDLTTKQRAREKEIYREVARKNLTRTRGEVVDNMAYKVVGPRGSRREIFAPLRPGERVGLEGDVVWEREGDTGFSDRRRLRGGKKAVLRLLKVFAQCQLCIVKRKIIFVISLFFAV